MHTAGSLAATSQPHPRPACRAARPWVLCGGGSRVTRRRFAPGPGPQSWSSTAGAPGCRRTAAGTSCGCRHRMCTFPPFTRAAGPSRAYAQRSTCTWASASAAATRAWSIPRTGPTRHSASMNAGLRRVSKRGAESSCCCRSATNTSNSGCAESAPAPPGTVQRQPRTAACQCRPAGQIATGAPSLMPVHSTAAGRVWTPSSPGITETGEAPGSPLCMQRMIRCHSSISARERAWGRGGAIRAETMTRRARGDAASVHAPAGPSTSAGRSAPHLRGLASRAEATGLPSRRPPAPSCSRCAPPCTCKAFHPWRQMSWAP